MKDGDYQLNDHQYFDDPAQLPAGLVFAVHKKKNGILKPEKLDIWPPVADMSFYILLRTTPQ